MFWARACYETNGSLQGPQDQVDCDESNVAFGVVLFDPIAAQLNSNESRITMRRLHWPSAVNLQVDGATAPAGWMWCVVIKTSDNLEQFTFVSTPLSTLLDGTKDVLDVRTWRLSNSYSGGTPITLNGGLEANSLPPEWTIQAQRKLEVDDKIVALFGFNPLRGQALGASQSYFADLGGVISVLWQRTLR